MVKFINFLNWCRLFQPNIDISQKKFYQLISSQYQNIIHQLISMIGLGQVRFIYLTLALFMFWSRSSLLFSIYTLHAAVYFLYDLSPITVTIKEERRSFLHFITRLCAVLGGTFAVTGFVLNYWLYCSSIDHCIHPRGWPIFFRPKSELLF